MVCMFASQMNEGEHFFLGMLTYSISYLCANKFSMKFVQLFLASKLNTFIILFSKTEETGILNRER